MMTPEEVETRIIYNEKQIEKIIEVQETMAKNAYEFSKVVQQITVELEKKGVI